MGTITKLEKQIVGAMLGLQLVLLLTVSPLIAALVPPALAAVPLGYAALGSEQTVRMMRPKLRRAYASVSVLGVAVAAFFLVGGNDLPFKLQVVRALLADAAIVWLATAIAVDVSGRAKGSLVHP